MLDFFKKNKCPLCGRIHRLWFHGFGKKRTYFDFPPDNSTDIVIGKSFSPIRLFCFFSWLKNKKKESKKQYTFTVLPAFIIPRARITLPHLLDACSLFYHGTSAKESVLQLPARNVKTFYHHHHRLLKYIPEYNLLLTHEIIQAGGSINTPKLQEELPVFNQFFNYGQLFQNILEKTRMDLLFTSDEFYPWLFACWQDKKNSTLFWTHPLSHAP